MTTRDIKIKKVLNGYIVKIGCQKVVFTSQKKLIKEMKRYWKNPVKVEHEYTEKYQPKNVTVVRNGNVFEVSLNPNFSIGYTFDHDFDAQEPAPFNANNSPDSTEISDAERERLIAKLRLLEEAATENLQRYDND